MTWVGRHRGSGGTTILTSARVEVREARHHRLRVAALMRTRGYAVARVAMPGSAHVVVASVHLCLKADERARHAATILATLGTGDPVVLAGDLNEEETGAAYRLIAGTLRLVSTSSPRATTGRPGSTSSCRSGDGGLDTA